MAQHFVEMWTEHSAPLTPEERMATGVPCNRTYGHYHCLRTPGHSGDHIAHSGAYGRTWVARWNVEKPPASRYPEGWIPLDGPGTGPDGPAGSKEGGN